MDYRKATLLKQKRRIKSSSVRIRRWLGWHLKRRWVGSFEQRSRFMSVNRDWRLSFYKEFHILRMRTH